MATDADNKIKAKVGKPPAKKAEPAKKPAATKAEPKKAAPKKAEAKGGQLKVTQIGSPIARRSDQRATLIGLGLNKMNRSRMLEDTPAIRGMVRKVNHLVKVENVG